MCTRNVILVIVLALTWTPSVAQECADENLLWPKLVITSEEVKSYPEALEVLKSFSKNSKSGEAEFYSAIIEHRQGHLKESQSSIYESASKKFYMSEAYYSFVYSEGAYGFSKDNAKAIHHFNEFLKLSSNCDEVAAEMKTQDKINELLSKLFG